MLISTRHRFIFFHGAKVAGTSIRAALLPYCDELSRFKIECPQPKIGGRENPIYQRWQSALLHVKAREAKGELSEEIYSNYLKFGFVRNPWDWQISMYHFILRETEHIRHQLVSTLGSFEEYLEWIVATKQPYPKGACKFQKDMFTDDRNELIVDYIGKFESLAEDFSRICERVGICAVVPHLNRTAHQHYQSYYNPRTRKLVQDHFADDIESFGYRF